MAKRHPKRDGRFRYFSRVASAALIYSKMSAICRARWSHLASEASLSFYISGMMRNPMRRTGTYIFALSAAAARPFSRSCDRRSLFAAVCGSLHLSNDRPEQGSQLRKPD